MKQNILNFKFSQNRDFFISPKNEIAFNMVQKWPDWNSQLIYIYGPDKCGKTLISSLWKKKSKAIFLDDIKLNGFKKNNIDIEDIKNQNWIIKYDLSVLSEVENTLTEIYKNINDNGLNGIDVKDLLIRFLNIFLEDSPFKFKP